MAQTRFSCRYGAASAPRSCLPQFVVVARTTKASPRYTPQRGGAYAIAQSANRSFDLVRRSNVFKGVRSTEESASRRRDPLGDVAARRTTSRKFPPAKLLYRSLNGVVR